MPIFAERILQEKNIEKSFLEMTVGGAMRIENEAIDKLKREVDLVVIGPIHADSSNTTLARDVLAQRAEAAVGCKILNHMSQLGLPQARLGAVFESEHM